MSADTDKRWTYRITVQGRLDASWSRWFNGLTIECTGTDDSVIITLTGPVVDQPALRGILNKLWDLNLILISVARLEKETPPPKEANHVASIRSLTG
jgi:hypothetical protein